ncbi:ABC transporter permease [Paenarthrobacter sp. NPDC092416]|uniref:ABC transporter permease n=1 Tax=Paenarthrobacter sp. NPDC092416 TaxID=3364386 RepID=UPI0037F24629
MSTFSVLAAKESQEIIRTWRVWVLPAIVMFFAVIGPPLAKITPELLGSLTANTPGSLGLPEATFGDAYGQWIKNLSQIVLFAIIIIYGGVVSTEIREGTAGFILTKPVSRTTFVSAKAAVHAGFITVVFALGTFTTWVSTQVTFAVAPSAQLWGAAFLLLLYGILAFAYTFAFSVLIPAPAGASGAGLGIYVLLAVGAAWDPLATYGPAGVPAIAAAVATGQEHVSPAWPAVTTLLAAAAAIGAAVLIFDRKELRP